MQCGIDVDKLIETKKKEAKKKQLQEKAKKETKKELKENKNSEVSNDKVCTVLFLQVKTYIMYVPGAD